MKIIPKNWRDFQHYKDRSPPWIRLHKSLLDNYEFQCLPVASRALAPMLWLIASDEKDGVIDADIAKLAFRLRQTAKEVEAALKPLIDNGFFSVEDSAINLLADRKQLAVPETETETETDTRETRSSVSEFPPGFDRFWSAYPKKTGKDAAIKAFAKRKPDKALVASMLDALRWQCQSEAWTKDRGQFIPNPATWLNQGRWTDEPVGAKASIYAGAV